jgi:hypothetical protein
MRTSLDVHAAHREVLAWLHGITVKAQREEDVTRNTASEVVTRFLSHSEPAGFSLSLLATGSLAEPRFAASWRWHHRVLSLPAMPDAPDRDEARLLACAALLSDGFFRRHLLQMHQFPEAA